MPIRVFKPDLNKAMIKISMSTDMRRLSKQSGGAKEGETMQKPVRKKENAN